MNVGAIHLKAFIKTANTTGHDKLDRQQIIIINVDITKFIKKKGFT